MEPTQWNSNPTVNTSNVVPYDSSTREYDVSTQPYDGFTGTTDPILDESSANVLDEAGNDIYSELSTSYPWPSNWKNPTTWQNSLVSPAEQQYYGGPSQIPLYGGPTQWVANADIQNQAGVYVESNSAYADLRPYDQSGAEYDVSSTTYDGVTVTTDSILDEMGGGVLDESGNQIYSELSAIARSFDNWKSPTQWEPITGGSDF